MYAHWLHSIAATAQQDMLSVFKKEWHIKGRLLLLRELGNCGCAVLKEHRTAGQGCYWFLSAFHIADTICGGDTARNYVWEPHTSSQRHEVCDRRLYS